MNESNLGAGGGLLDRGRFFGTAVAHRLAGEITLVEGRYAGHTRVPPHAHCAPYFCLVLEGWFEEACGSRRETCGPGTLVFHRAHEVHADHFGAAGARCFNLELAPSLAERLDDEGTLPRSRRTLAPGRAGAMAAALRSSPARSVLDIEDAVLALLAELGPGRDGPTHHDRRPAWLGRTLERLHGPAPPSIAALAHEAGVHPVYFARAFRAAVHSPPSAVARGARLERASAALLASEAPVTVVAHAAGFSDHSHFCRHFRRAFGVTPSRYRALFADPRRQRRNLARIWSDPGPSSPYSSTTVSPSGETVPGASR